MFETVVLFSVLVYSAVVSSVVVSPVVVPHSHNVYKIKNIINSNSRQLIRNQIPFI